MVGSEVYSAEVKKTEVLMENFRRAIGTLSLSLSPSLPLSNRRSAILIHVPLGLRIKENKEVYEGEVTEISAEETENPFGGYGKTIAHVIVGLKTAKGTKQLKLDPTVYESLQKEKVLVGDVVYIESNRCVAGTGSLA